MGVFDKIKNALFEEEYVEVDEKPKKVKKEKIRKETKEVIKESKVKENKPIAKKVVLPDKPKIKEEELEEVELEEEDFEISPISDREELKEDFKFPMMEDKDFKVEDSYESEPKIVKIIEEDVHPSRRKDKYDSYSVKEEKPLYEGSKNTKNTKVDYGYTGSSIDDISYKEPKGAYGLTKEETPSYDRLYEKKEEKAGFKPSPIISPIYGVLDKNYRKEDVVSKKEVRLTSSYARENLDVDDVRKKAFGTLADDIARGVDDEEEPTFEVNEIKDSRENLLVDLSEDEGKPAVHEVTVGDAEEYFQDLGLEYNIDYKDASKDNKLAGRRVKNDEEYTDVNAVNEEVKVEVSASNDVDNDNDNLFDLIDSMYTEK